MTVDPDLTLDPGESATVRIGKRHVVITHVVDGDGVPALGVADLAGKEPGLYYLEVQAEADPKVAAEAVIVVVRRLVLSQRPSPALIGLEAQPPLSTAEVMLAAGQLARDGYLTVEDDGDGLTYYLPTREGIEYADNLTARGT